jgi:hypothetical protein
VGSVESRLEKEDLPWLGLLHGLVEIGLSVDPEGSGGSVERDPAVGCCCCCCGEAVEAGGASVVFAPVVGSGGWPCC